MKVKLPFYTENMLTFEGDFDNAVPLCNDSDVIVIYRQLSIQMVTLPIIIN